MLDNFVVQDIGRGDITAFLKKYECDSLENRLALWSMLRIVVLRRLKIGLPFVGD